MTKGRFYRLIAITTALLLALAYGSLLGPAIAGEGANSAGVTPAAPATQASAPGGGPHEGIKVHGDWVIEVRNPDGTLVERREFKNVLVAGGNGGRLFLASLLARGRSVGLYQILLNGEIAANPCFNLTAFGTFPSPCTVVELGSELRPGPGFFRTLTVTNPEPETLVLSGTATAERAGNIRFVATRNGSCDKTVAPVTPCGSDLFFFITSTTLDPPIPVALNQQIQVTVTISFN